MIACLKYEIVFAKPALLDIFGSQFNFSLASVMSGSRFVGSSAGRGR